VEWRWRWELVQKSAEVETHANRIYQVRIRRREGIVWLSIKRHDQEPARDWRDLQRIKNELVGPEHEAVELFPAESRKTDGANQTHLWVLADPKARWPFGFEERLVTSDPATVGFADAKQRPFDPDDPWNTETVPDDLPRFTVIKGGGGM